MKSGPCDTPSRAHFIQMLKTHQADLGKGGQSEFPISTSQELGQIPKVGIMTYFPRTNCSTTFLKSSPWHCQGAAISRALKIVSPKGI